MQKEKNGDNNVNISKQYTAPLSGFFVKNCNGHPIYKKVLANHVMYDILLSNVQHFDFSLLDNYNE